MVYVIIRIDLCAWFNGTNICFSTRRNINPHHETLWTRPILLNNHSFIIRIVLFHITNSSFSFGTIEIKPGFVCCNEIFITIIDQASVQSTSTLTTFFDIQRCLFMDFLFLTKNEICRFDNSRDRRLTNLARSSNFRLSRRIFDIDLLDCF